MAIALPMLAPILAGFAAPELAGAIGLTGALAGGLGIGLGTAGDIIGAGAGALTGGLINHGALGALEGGLGGFGGSLLDAPVNAGLSSALGLGSAAAPSGSLALPLGAPDALSESGMGMSTLGGDVSGQAAMDAANGILGPVDAASAAGNAISTPAGDVPLAATINAPVSSLLGAASGAASGAGLTVPSLPGAGALPAVGSTALNLQGGTLPTPPTPPGQGASTSSAVPPPVTNAITPGSPNTVAGPNSTVAPTSTGTASGTAAGGASNPTGGGFLSSALGYLGKNPGLALALGGIGVSSLERPAIPGVNQSLTSGNVNPQSALGQEIGIAQQAQGQIAPDVAEASTLTNTANPEISALTTGTLPPGVAQLFQTQLANQITAIKARYASLGEPGSTAETEDIQNAQNEMASQEAAYLMQVSQQGLATEQSAQSAAQGAINAAGLPASTYSNIANLEVASDQQLSNAISNIVGAAAGSSKGLTVAL